MLNREQIVSQLNNSRFAVTVVEQTQSTNSDLKALALSGAPEGTTLIVERQTAGRGRRGRTFASPEGGLYLSTLLRPAQPVKPGRITCLAAVAAARAIESLCDVHVDIKWVNDLYLNGRKVAGILAEGVLSPAGELTAVVLGIGLNVSGTLPEELSSIATTLQQEGATLTREDVAAAFLNEWERVYTAPPEEGMAEYAKRNLVLEREITVVQGDATYPATALAITPAGHLRVRTADGERELSSGEVSVRL
ncbi:MAG: biotin--[acetyl-CoA-carboxylase] ligase [Ruminococcaceae bacterium]|nr:biotin--[acetyl-CoA-carboxylase] ligase [Oscillospiraceae bacterium]